METKNKKYKNLIELKTDINSLAAKAEERRNELEALIMSAFGRMPQNQLELVEFIERIIELKKHD